MYSTNNLSVLLVDDNADLLQYWSTALARSFKAVHLAGHAYAAMETLHRKEVDVIIADTQLPEMDGFSFCQELKRHATFFSIPVVLYKSGYITLEDKRLAAKSGAEQVVSQPASVENLIRLLKDTYTENRVQTFVDTQGESLDNDPKYGGYADFLTKKLSDTINQLKKEQQTLNTALSRFKDFAYSVGDYFWETDAEMRLTFLGTGPENRLSLPTGHFKDQHFKEFFQEHLNSGGLAEFEKMAAREQPLEISCELNGQDTSRLVQIIGQPYYSGIDGFAGYRGSIIDVTDTKLSSEKLYFDAHHDSLTGLLNKRAFEAALRNAMQGLQPGQQHVLCYLDLDFFKEVNDTAGHRAGDELLNQLANLFRNKVRSNDVLARIGGDEFSIFLQHCSLDQARRLVQDLHNSIKTFRFFWENHCFEVGLSIGLLEITDANLSVQAVMDLADQACYAAKRSGRNQIHVYGDEQSTGKLAGDALWLEKFHSAVKHDQLCLFQQPIRRQFPGSGAYTNAYEILVRMRDGERLIAPKYFLSVIERYQQTHILDRWVFNRVFEWLSADGGENTHGEFYSINISSASFCDPEFRQHVHARLKSSSLVARKLCFEITESTTMENLANAIEFISEMRSLGCRFALDDFGTGFSSLAHLKNLPVDFVKLDGMFIKGITTDPVDYGLVESIQTIAGMMNIKTIAEYVENEEIEIQLKRIGVDYLQGFHIGHPEMIPFTAPTEKVASLAAP